MSPTTIIGPLRARSDFSRRFTNWCRLFMTHWSAQIVTREFSSAIEASSGAFPGGPVIARSRRGKENDAEHAKVGKTLADKIARNLLS